MKVPPIPSNVCGEVTLYGLLPVMPPATVLGPHYPIMSHAPPATRKAFARAARVLLKGG